MITLSTSQKYELVDLTNKVEEVVEESGVGEGICLVFVPHATAAVILNENEGGLKQDFVKFFKELVEKKSWAHDQIDDNASAHLLAGVIGQSRVLPISKGKLVHGTWQNILFVELDGPRSMRKVFVEISRFAGNCAITKMD